MQIPEGVPPEGDCVSPRAVTITLFEDRLGNHVGVICSASGKELKRFFVQYRDSGQLKRRNFSCPSTTVILANALHQLEEENAAK